MLQIQVFELSKKGAAEANEFIKKHRLIENGVQVRDNVICVLHDTATHLDEKSKEVILMQTLAAAESKLLECQVLKEQFDLAEAGGEKFDLKFTEDRRQNDFILQWSQARIYIVKKMLGLDTNGLSVFGKKQYDSKSHEDSNTDN